MERILSLLLNTGHQAPGPGVLVLLVLLALVLPLLTNHLGRRHSGGSDRSKRRKK